MGKRTRKGICRICGNEGQLSFEHVPPKSAFNDRPMVRIVGKEIIKTHPDNLQYAKGPVDQRGQGAYTLCPRCNNDTGLWYGPAYADWAYQGVNLIDHATKAPSLYHIFHVFPLRVIKQIFSMFLSLNENLHEAHEELVRFVLNKDRCHTNPRLRVFAYFNAALVTRHSAISGRLNLNRRSSNIFSELAFPPFGYVLAPDGKSPDDELAEISFFSRYPYNKWTDVPLRLPVFHIYTWIPGDFRSRDEVLKDSENQS